MCWGWKIVRVRKKDRERLSEAKLRADSNEDDSFSCLS